MAFLPVRYRHFDAVCLFWQLFFALLSVSSVILRFADYASQADRRLRLSRPPYLTKGDAAPGVAPNFEEATFDQGTHASR
jgi:hypothetical protein